MSRWDEISMIVEEPPNLPIAIPASPRIHKRAIFWKAGTGLADEFDFLGVGEALVGLLDLFVGEVSDICELLE